MWPLPVPLRQADRSYLVCVIKTAEAERRKRLLKAASTVRKAGQALRQAAAAKSLHDLDREDFAVPQIPTEDFVKWAYGNGMQTVAGRKIRDELMTAPINDRCPLCRQGAVRELDHFMPKSLFPSLCVDPLNLVPVCGECNSIKGNMSPDRAENTLMHPYLDRIAHQRWLDARAVHDSGSVRLEFFVSHPTSWDSTLRARIDHHFKVFSLGHRYAVDANRVICDVAHRLDQLRARPGGAVLVRDYLQDEAETRLSQEPNSIEGVTYAALAADDCYCRGG